MILSPYIKILRNAIAMILLVLVAFKIVSPLISMKCDVKACSVLMLDEKDAEDSKTGIEKDAASDIEMYFVDDAHILPKLYDLAYTCPIHYIVTYIPQYFKQITIPPPDGDLSSIA